MNNEANSRIRLSASLKPAGSPASEEDAALVKLSQGGSMDAFEQLVIRHQKRMLNVAFRLTSDYDDACEIVQDAFVSAFRNIRTFRREAKFTTWLTTITVNLSKNRLQQRKSLREHVTARLDDPLWLEDIEIAREALSREPSALDVLEKRDVLQQVRDCIKALDPEYRELIVLRDMQDFSYDDIGAMLCLREGTVKSRLFRAREAVKICLKKVMGAL